jgi:NDP-sugar pyrophosphorylase family protein
MKMKMGKKIVEIISKPVPIPIEIFERIFRNLYLVHPKIFKTIAMKNANERKNITKRLIKVRLINAKINKIVIPTVG